MTGNLPKQLLPYIGLHFNLSRGVPEGVREAVLLARGWGLTKAQIIHAVAFSVGSVAGLEGAYAIEDPVAEVLETWEEEGGER